MAIRARSAPRRACSLPPSADAPPAARLREAGAILFAKTTMPDYGMLSSGLSSFHPLTRNPWRLDAQSRRLLGRRRGGGRGRLRSAASWHRHRRLRAPARRLVRLLRPQAERRPRPDRSALRRARRRAIDAQRRRRGADDGERCRGPTTRDYVSLPPQNARLAIAPATARAGCGSGCCSKRAAAIQAARGRARGGRSGRRAISPPPAPIVEPLAPFLTQDMLDGLDRFWRMRALSRLPRHAPERRPRSLPFIRAWANRPRISSGETAVPRLQPDAGDAQGGRRRHRCPMISCSSPTAPITAFAAELAIAERRSAQSLRPYRLHRRLQYVGTAGGVDQLRL